MAHPLTANMKLALRSRTERNATSILRKPVRLYELYPKDYYPARGEHFDPGDAVALFSEVERTWLGRVYTPRVTDCSDIGKHVTAEFNGCTVTFSNVGEGGAKPMSQFVLENNVARMRLVVRYTDRDLSETLQDSVVMYVGRLEPVDMVSSEQCELSSKETLGSTEHEVPRREFSPDDPLGRSPDDPLFEGIRSVANRGVSYYTQKVEKTFLLVFHHSKDEQRSKQWSTENDNHEGDVIPYIDGRCSMEGIVVTWQDEGNFIRGVYVWAGHKITDITEVTNNSEGFFIQAIGPKHLGDLGGTGTNAAPEFLFESLGLMSRTAFQQVAVGGSKPDVQDPAAVMSAILYGEADLPDEDGAFTLKGFSDNPAVIARRKLVDTDFFGINPNELDDDETLNTAALCDEFVRDVSNSETLVVTQPVADAIASGAVKRFRSTSMVNPQYWKWERDPDFYAGPWYGFVLGPDDVWDLDEPVPPTIAAITRFRRRFTYNAPLTDKMKAIDFLRNYIYASARLWDRTNFDGRLAILMERPADSAYLTASAEPLDEWVQMPDVEPWRVSKEGHILIGAGLVTSEVRDVVAAEYAIEGEDITLSVDATGSLTLVINSSFGGWSPSVPAQAEIELGGVVGAGLQAVVTVDGVEVAYTLEAEDDLGSATMMLAVAINTDLELRQYVKAEADDATRTVLLFSKLGRVQLDRPLDNGHDFQLRSPTDAPSAAIVPGGTLKAGAWLLAYSWETPTGETMVSPTYQAVVPADGRKLNVAALVMPLGASSVNWFLSRGANDETIIFHSNRATGAAFSVTDAPIPGSRVVPQVNNAGEESIRIMFDFTAENIRDKFEWPLAKSAESTNQVLIKYKSAIDGWKDKEYRANDYGHQREFNRVNTLEISGVGIDNHAQAVMVANAKLAFEQDGAFQVRWNTDEAGIAFQQGDVGCVTDDSGLTRQSVRVEHMLIHPNNDVEFTARVYSTHMMGDLTGVKEISISSPLKYLTGAPPPAINVTLAEGHLVSAGNTWISTIVGSFDFDDFLGGQLAHIYVKWEGAGSYQIMDNVPQDPDSHGAFELLGPPRTTPGNGHKIKIVTESRFGKTDGLAAATEYTVFVNGPPALTAPANLITFFEESVDGDALVDWSAGTNQVDSASQEVHELEVRDVANTTTLRGPIRVAPSELTNLQEYILWGPQNGATLVGEGGFDLGVGQDPGGAMMQSLSTIEVVGGALAEFEAPSVANESWQSMCQYVSIFPTSSYGYSGDFAFLWHFIQPVDHPTEWWAYPEGSAGGVHDAYRRRVVAGAKYGVYLRPDGVAEYHINYVPGAAPIFISARPVVQSELYRAFATSVGGPGGVRHARWRRQGPEWKFIGRAQRLLYSGTEAGALPTDIAIRVRQLSPWSNGTHSPWTFGAFARP